MLDKTYRPQEVEGRIYAAWEEGGWFRPKDDHQARPYCIVLPPPNVTGSLHMGHALDHTIQDVLVRYHRMLGDAVLWQPGTDHAGIATQMVVERELAKAGANVTRKEIGRAAFLAKVWDWKAQSGGTIVRQMRRLGQSPDWSRERFTMDEGLSAAVRKAFVELWRAGLIYKDKRLVNWDCQLQTAVSDLEVQPTEVDGQLWHISYPIEGTDRRITVATTRPETMLGDTGVAVHPKDPRYADLVGRQAILPLVGRRIPIVADEYSDPEKGTGAVKITPAHDFNDFEVGRRHGLAMISILDGQGAVNANAPEAYRGLGRFQARKRIVADLEAAGHLEKVERHRHTVPHGDRSGTPLEPFLTDQWYCDAGKLAIEAIRAVEDGRTRFVPRQWEATYFEWMRNIQPWCISRQLWWGHQIPAWYGPDGTIFVAPSEAEAIAQARAHYGDERPIVQDEDVLDTWFSSGLWPFSTLGWPDATPELARFYPNDVLVTGFDIIFFWVARMMMLGLHFMGEVPFKDVVIHGLVRDERGQKMSKTKGNVIDPLELADQYGADALRLALLASTAQGRDVKFGPARVEGYRNFVTKLWNAARFIELNGGQLDPAFDPGACTVPVNRWIVGEVARTAAAVSEALDAYRLNDAALTLYHFVWDTFCDWWIELAKPALTGDDVPARAEARSVAAWVLARTLHLLHPMAPFVTEELWDRLLGKPGGMLIASPWPKLNLELVDGKATTEVNNLIAIARGIRAVKAEYNVANTVSVRAIVAQPSAELDHVAAVYGQELWRLAGISGFVKLTGNMPLQSANVAAAGGLISIPLAGVVDIVVEGARLDRELLKLTAERDKLEGRLGNAEFVAKAPEEVVAEQRERLAELDAAILRLTAARERIG